MEIPYVPAIPLPTRKLTEKDLAGLHPWLRPFTKAGVKETQRLLAEFWSVLKSNPLKRLSKKLLKIEKTFLLVLPQQLENRIYDPQTTWLVMEVESVDHQTSKKAVEDFLLGPPPQPSGIKKIQKIQSAGTSLVEFYSFFHNFRESIPPDPGFFIPPHRWELAKRKEHLPKFEGIGPWLDAYVIFEARNGDEVLMAPSGKLCWAVLETYSVKPLADTFDDYIDHYVRYKKFCYPFDAWGAKYLGIKK